MKNTGQLVRKFEEVLLVGYRTRAITYGPEPRTLCSENVETTK
ncbi:MAG: hypothetical protein ACJAZ1_001450 [Yoonia sp.]|jgi:hypothetical protein